MVLLLLGGHSIAKAQSAGTFTETGGMTIPRAGHTATLLTNGKVLVAGGTADYIAPIATAELYDPETRLFSRTGSMTAPRYYHTATLLPDGRVLVAGGGTRSGGALIPSNGAEIYDPSTGTFTATGNMVGDHVCQQANLLGNGKVLIVGGYDARGRVSDAELYNPATGTFAATGMYSKNTFDLNSCQGVASSSLPDGRVLLVWQDIGADVYDPSTGSFTATSNPIDQGYNNGLPTATLLMNGKVLVAGGASDSGFGTRAGFYNPSTGAFGAEGNMTSGRALHTATLLPDGNVLMAGSYLFGGGSLASSELYDPVTGAFTPIGTMTTSRSHHTATLLPDGRVLIAGGSTSGQSTSRAELYHPSVLIPAPRLFSVPQDGTTQGVIWHASTGEIASPVTPAGAGEALSMYTTSLDNDGLIVPQVAIGGQLAEVLYVGAAPGYPGYHQVNFRLPGGVAPGPAAPVRLTYIGRPSNSVNIAVR